MYLCFEILYFAYFLNFRFSSNHFCLLLLINELFVLFYAFILISVFQKFAVFCLFYCIIYLGLYLYFCIHFISI